MHISEKGEGNGYIKGMKVFLLVPINKHNYENFEECF